MVTIRLERAADAAAREALLDAAYGPARFGKPSERLRAGRKLGLAFVAVENSRVVGTVRLWSVSVGSDREALLLGPLAVEPGHQRRGIGSALMRHAMAAATRRRHGAVLLVGDAAYYGRFGFSAARTDRLWLAGLDDKARLLGCELVAGALTDGRGTIRSPKHRATPLAAAAAALARPLKPKAAYSRGTPSADGPSPFSYDPSKSIPIGRLACRIEGGLPVIRPDHTFVVAALVLLGSAMPVRAEDFPSRVVTIINPYAPGGSAELSLRPVSDMLAKIWKHPVIIETRAGGGTTIAASYIAEQKPDGYRLLYTPVAAHTISGSLFTGLKYHPVRSFTPISGVSTSPYLVLVNASSPIRTIADLVAHAKANPGKINYGSSGAGTGPHLTGEILKQSLGIDTVHISFKGGAGQHRAAGRSHRLFGHRVLGARPGPVRTVAGARGLQHRSLARPTRRPDPR